MNKNIRFQGLSLTPDELAAPEGSLALSANVEIHDASLRPSLIKGEPVTTPLKVSDTVARLQYVHTTVAYTHFIASVSERDGVKACWFSADGTYGGAIDHWFRGIDKIESVGNTLVILDSEGIHYILWDGKQNKYKYLGQQPPFVDLQFALSEQKTCDDWQAKKGDVTNIAVPEQEGIDNDDFTISGTTVELKNQQSLFTEAAWAVINRTNAVTAEKGYFYAPFLVRYCYRLYDGSSILHSAPIIMPVAIKDPFRVIYHDVHKDREGNAYVKQTRLFYEEDNSMGYALTYYPSAVALTYRNRTSSAFTTLKNNWKDIVKSIDIFVSPQVTPYKQDSLISSMSFKNENWGVRDAQVKSLVPDLDGMIEYYGALDNYRVMSNEDFFDRAALDLPRMSEEEYITAIRNTSNFYLFHSFNLEDTLATSYTEINDGINTQGIVAREQMTDDYKTHNLLIPMDTGKSSLYVYNHRLNASALKERLYEGFPLYNPWTDTLYGYMNIRKIIVLLNTDQGPKTVIQDYDSGHTVSFAQLSTWLFFYPDARAVKTIVVISYTHNGSTVIGHYVFSMKQHPQLNGAYADVSFMLKPEAEAGYSIYWPANGDYSATVDDLVEMPNKIYTSEVNNPYYFPVSGINTVGTGTVLAIASTTRALTQGQFGQFPLIAFTTDGIWALSVSSTGSYSAIHPISRDVCTNPKSVCQLDQSVAFVNTRGLARVVEQNVVPMSEQLIGPWTDIEHVFDELYTYFQSKTDIQKLIRFSDDPISFLQTAVLLYDPASARILCIPGQASAADITADSQVIFAYSTTDQTWSTLITKVILAAVAGYPHPYIQQQDGYVICLGTPYPYDSVPLTAGSGSAAAQPIDGLILSRALSFGDAMYAIADIAHHKMAASRPMMFIYGSNDLRQWHYVGRTNQTHVSYLPAHSYRYFRIALALSLVPSEQYISTSLNIQEKFPKL